MLKVSKTKESTGIEISEKDENFVCNETRGREFLKRIRDMHTTKKYFLSITKRILEEKESKSPKK